MADTKAEWRERLLRARRSIDSDTRRQAGVDVVARLAGLTEFAAARSVLLYVALGAEVDVGDIAPAAWRAGKDVYRPSTLEPPPTWSRLEPTHTPHPVSGSGIEADVARGAVLSADTLPRPALVLAPGLGFDECGGRLGRGRGYYDRAIAALRTAGEVIVVGVAYDAQVTTTLPLDPWDQPVDLVVTERRVLVPRPCRDASRRDGQEVRDDL